MFLLTTDPGRATTALGALSARMPVGDPPVHRIDLGSHTLVWNPAPASQNLHRFTDGVVIGKLDPGEAPNPDPAGHPRPLPARLPPVLPATVIRRRRRGLTVEPQGITNVFHSPAAVSDRQLLVAAHDRLAPSPASVAVLTAVSHFPGDATLFDGVERIPFLHHLDLATGATVRRRDLTLPEPDDRAMLDRLVEVVPRGVPHALALSAGYDSRVVLGVLRAAGVDLRIVRFDNHESELVQQITGALGLQVVQPGHVGDPTLNRSPGEWTVMTDAQVWFGMSQRGRLGQACTQRDYCHSGQFADSMTKNTYKTAWKVPDPRSPFWTRLVHHALLPNVPARLPALREMGTSEELTRHVRGLVEYQRGYLDFRTHKQEANWLHFMNRGMRWVQGWYEDLTFSTNSVFLMSDLDAQLLGIASPFWPNFSNDRAKALAQALLPELKVPYANGQGPEPPAGLAGAYGKVRYEYLKRVKQRRAGREKLGRNRTPYGPHLPTSQPAGWESVYTVAMEEAAGEGWFGSRRVAVTVAHAMDFLESVPA